MKTRELDIARSGVVAKPRRSLSTSDVPRSGSSPLRIMILGRHGLRVLGKACAILTVFGGVSGLFSVESVRMVFASTAALFCGVFLAIFEFSDVIADKVSPARRQRRQDPGRAGGGRRQCRPWSHCRQRNGSPTTAAGANPAPLPTMTAVAAAVPRLAVAAAVPAVPRPAVAAGVAGLPTRRPPPAAAAVPGAIAPGGEP